MSREAWCNLGLGLSVVSWAALGMTAAEPGAWRSPVRWSVASLNVLIGLLLIVRRPVRFSGRWRDLALALPGLVIAGVALRLAPLPVRWPANAQAVFLAGTGVTLWSAFWLGRSFAVLPSLRRVVSRGPYRWVRHPAYAGELIMVAACALASARPGRRGRGFCSPP